MTTEHDTPVDAYVAAAATPGSIDYYVLLFAGPEHRTALSAALALGKVIMNIARQDTEKDIRRLKLQWWLEELTLIEKGKTRHPLSAALADAAAHRQWVGSLERLVAGAQRDIDREQFDSLSQVLPYGHYAAERQALLAGMLPGCDDHALANARAAGVGICLTEMLCLPDRRLPAGGFADSDELPAPQLASIAADHFAAMEPRDTSTQFAIWLQARLYSTVLGRLQARGFDAATATPRPFQLLWQAWREARKLRR